LVLHLKVFTDNGSFSGGGVYFSEFDGFNARQYTLFFLAVGIIFVGVLVLGDRLKNSHV
jgi:hypothetical protein